MGSKVDMLVNHIRKLNGSCVVEGHGCHTKSSESGHRSLDHRAVANPSEIGGNGTFGSLTAINYR